MMSLKLITRRDAIRAKANETKRRPMQRVLPILPFHPPGFAGMATWPLVRPNAMTAKDHQQKRCNFREGTVFIA